MAQGAGCEWAPGPVNIQELLKFRLFPGRVLYSGDPTERALLNVDACVLFVYTKCHSKREPMSNEIGELREEMRNGFIAMRERFDGVDKRLAIL